MVIIKGDTRSLDYSSYICICIYKFMCMFICTCVRMYVYRHGLQICLVSMFRV